MPFIVRSPLKFAEVLQIRFGMEAFVITPPVAQISFTVARPEQENAKAFKSGILADYKTFNVSVSRSSVFTNPDTVVLSALIVT